MSQRLELHNDRLFPVDPSLRSVARELYQSIKSLPIISPHGHTDPAWFANNDCFPDPYTLLVAPDHYLLRMLYSQGVSMAEMGIPQVDGSAGCKPREAWQVFAGHQHLFAGTPSGLWMNHVFREVFGRSDRLSESTADEYFDSLSEQLVTDPFRPRQIFDRFNIEFLATTESALDPLSQHKLIRASDWDGQVVSTYRPDSVTDPEHPQFQESLLEFEEITQEDVATWDGYLRAHRQRRADFIALGTTASDHGHPTARTANLSAKDCRTLYRQVISGDATPGDAELFRAQMLTEMARMSLDDGLVLQIHPGSHRNHNPWLFENYGADRGADMPTRMEYTAALKPLLDEFGNNAELTIIVFTLDETTYARELAPLAGHYPSLLLGPPWWFNDSPAGIARFREQAMETAGFYNTAGFNDDTRALLSISARHDMSRRMDCSYLARLVCEHRLSEQDAHSIALDLTTTLPRRAYRINAPARGNADG
ncbi:MAG: glucuronate isomerase [Pseudomonadota bacterium]